MSVKKGQLLLRVQSNDVSGAYQNYLKAENDERLARLNLERARFFMRKAPLPKALWSRLKRGQDRSRPTSTRHPNNCAFSGSIRTIPPESSTSLPRSPASSPISRSRMRQACRVFHPNPFTIADLSYVWIVCDVYENDLDAVRVGRIRRYPFQRLSQSAVQGTHRQHPARSSTPPPHRQGSPRGQESRTDPDRNVCHRNLLRQKTEMYSRPFQPARFCISTIAIGSTRRSATGHFKRA